ncbi:cholesterol 16,22-dihydroxylase CYP90G4-like isoform X2 [Elaeis guineensis]|uniref:Cytochrome P450 90B1-like isoform X2 n=1 Tax=Elaeis guineensis var. tenera TaxID=51953 RepID=A0A6J0PJ20_ELAGV|nr:cytochrome P450 90B1-like isoform X2 [Elaeis guineensis]
MEISPWLSLILLFFSALVALVTAWSLKGTEKRYKGLNLPPGSMGWPLLGETIAFRKGHPCTRLGEYMEKRINKYGKIFKSNLHGAPTVVSADAELNRFILHNDGRLFEPSWPTSLVNILGKKSMIIASGDTHHYLKSLAINFMSVPRLCSHFLGDAEQSILQTFSTWVEHTPFPLKEEAIKMSFNLIVKHILSKKPGEPETEQLRKLFMCFMRGAVAMPINLPGTAYRKALKSRAAILTIIYRLMAERIHQKKDGWDEIGEDSDLLGFILEQSNLDAEQFADLLLGLLFGGHETSSTAMTLAIYFLGDSRRALEELREEHIQIVKLKKERGETGALTWQDYKKMEFTRCTLSASTTRDDSYMAFSHGIRRCPGQELAKMEITIFLHHFVLNFDWESAELDHPLASPFPEFPKGLPIKVHKLSLDM